LKEKALWWLVLAICLSLAGWTTLDAWHRVGAPQPGFGVLRVLLVGIGGPETSALEPFDLVRVMNGQVLTAGREVQDEVRRHPPGTVFHYIVSRRGQLVEEDIPSRLQTIQGFKRFVMDAVLPGLLYLALGAAVLILKPGVPQTRVFLAACLTWFAGSALYADAVSEYRFDWIFLTAWAFSPAVYLHLARIFPEPHRVATRYPRLIVAAYVLSAVDSLLLVLPPPSVPRAAIFWLPLVSAIYWGAAMLVLVLSLAKTAVGGATAIGRQRGRVLLGGLAIGQLVPVLATAWEMVSGARVPFLFALWRLNILFPIAVAYAMARYDLFDFRGILRLGTIYGVVTGVVVAVYAGAIAGLNVLFGRLEDAVNPLVPAAVVALAVVLFLNPVYSRTQALVDRLFFRQRLDVRRSIEQLADTMTSALDLDRIAASISRVVDEAFHPVRQTLAIFDEPRGGFRVLSGSAGPMGAGGFISAESSLALHLAEERSPLTRARHEEDPELASCRESCVAQMSALGIDLVLPVLFRERLTGLLGLGEKRSGAAYSTSDLRLLRTLVNQSAVALENARAYADLQDANRELGRALRRVEMLESIRANLSKFVPRTVRELIEQAPEAPELAKREMDVTVLFVDIAGYTRLAERHDADRLNEAVERYFGAFLDEIIGHGGDINETAGDGLMVIFQDEDPESHARAAVETALGIVRRAREINLEVKDLPEPIQLHVGVNSGSAQVGATKLEAAAGTRWTYTASGPVTNVAARLAALGIGDEVFIGPETARRLDGSFTFEDLGEQPLRNVEDPVHIYRLAAA
jgi:class 3 adenylate cyclase